MRVLGSDQPAPCHFESREISAFDRRPDCLVAALSEPRRLGDGQVAGGARPGAEAVG